MLTVLLGILSLAACSPIGGYQPRDGDVIFQTSRSSQSQAIQLATKSPYSHMGIVYVGQDGEPSVFEAVQPVKLTPLAEWISRGEGRRFAAKRLVNADSILTPEKLAAMKRVGESFAGLDYDLFFEWTDERMYCSELVWKIFDLGAGVDIGDLEALGDFDLSHSAVQAKLRERFGDRPRLDEIVISSAAMFRSEKLETVYER